MFQEFPEDNKNDDFLNEFRQKISTQDTPNFEEKRNEMNRSKNVFIGAVSGVALAGIVGWFVLAPRYSDNPSVEIPVIRRPQTAIKVQPSEPGGMEILNQDKTVYDIIDKKDVAEGGIEQLLPPPEEPKLPQIAPQPMASEFEDNQPTNIATDNTQVVDDIINEAKNTEVISQAKEIVEIEQPVAPKELKEEKTISIAEVSKEPIPVVEKVSVPAKPVAVEIQKPDSAKEIKAVDTPKAVSNEKNIPTGPWQIQLASSKNKASIEKSWLDMVKKYPVLSGVSHEIETADLDFDGIFYRLKAGGYRDRTDADKLCKDIKALGGSCFVKKK